MSVRWTKGSRQTFEQLPERIFDQLYDALAEAMAEVVKQAAITARAYTAQRGRPTSSGSGRIDTGAMAEAIESEVEKSARQIVGKFGFINKQADYFVYQTITGFRHVYSGDFIEPTFALRDAAVQAEGDLVARMRAAIRSVRI